MVTSTAAARPEMLAAYPELFMGYVEILPNAKLPPKFLEASLLAEHDECGPLFKYEKGVESSKPANQANKLGIHIRAVMTKYRDLAKFPPKMDVFSRQAEHKFH